ncbi:hypothetical protein P8935_20345 [Telmatobacter sp. DSM 110680]|uniref:PilZ domain-containing protein n=1 Tax=Telmatobacter sp. DSM 110680 TaxID=3036704 RepID=A0AAU7DFX0_9BACT
MSLPETWYRLPFVYRPRAERRASPALAAFHWDGSIPRQNHVANISSSGAYLLTSECWKAGDIVSLTLQRSGILESRDQRRYTVQAKTIRRDDQGVAVAFLMPRGSDVRLWQSTIKAGAPQTEPEDVVFEFRLAAALAFIERVTPAASNAARLLMRRGLSNHRLESAVEIALHAEELLALEGCGAGFHLDPKAVIRILEDGSWTEVDWIQHWWAGLLATSCVTGAGGKSDLKFVSLLSQITTIQARILAGACSLAQKSIAEECRKPLRPLTCSAKELIRITGTHDRVRIERDIVHLVELGLIEKSLKWRFFSLLDQAVITPTETAVELYARCHGRRGAENSTKSSMDAKTVAAV